MATKIEKILNDLYLIDPSLKKMEKELTKIIKKVLKDKPDTELNDDFKESLRRDIVNRIHELKVKPKFSFSNFLNSLFLQKYAFALAILFLIVVSPFVYFEFSKPQNIQIAEESSDELQSQEESSRTIAPVKQEELTLHDLLKSAPVFANTELAYNPVQINPNIKESEKDPMNAKNIEDMEKSLGVKFSDDQIKFLKENKFLLLDIYNDKGEFCFEKKDNDCIPVDNQAASDDMLSLFSSFAGSGLELERNPSNAIYVNSDIILHSYHVFFDRYLKRLEEKNLYPLLVETISALQEKSFAAMSDPKNIEEKSSLNRVAAYLTVGKVLLETASLKPDQLIDQNTDEFFKNLEKYKNIFDDETYKKMKDEISFIVEAKSTDNSPLFGLYNPKGLTDYTQFTVRGHYTENSILRAYFRAMMLFGRQTFYFASDEGFDDAITLTYLLSDPQIQIKWANISDVTNFIAGSSDDITYSQFKMSIADSLDQNYLDLTLSDLFNDENINKMKKASESLPNPKIFSEIVVDDNMGTMSKEDLLLASKGLRLFGQKFTFDEYILNNLSAGSENTDIALPSTPSSLFVAGTIGSDLVKDILPRWILGNNKNLNPDDIWNKIISLRSEFSDLTPQDWLSNISAAWLWSLSPLVQNYGEGYPSFMQNKAYETKNLQSVLGSYTELKHDTVLYDKQVYAKLNGASDNLSTEKPEIVKGFVEPDMEFWNRMIALTKFTEDGLQSKNLLDMEAKGRFDTFLGQLYFYQNIASKELQNQQISEEEYESLRTTFWKVSELIRPFDNAVIEDEDKKIAIVADIQTDALKGQVLYEATGNPLIMLAFVSDQGTARLVVGLAFRHFEFTEPLDGEKRLTDQDWKKKVDENDLPDTPFYYQDLFVK